MEFQAKTRKRGNSLAIIIPRAVVAELNLKPDEEVIVEIKKKSTHW